MEAIETVFLVDSAKEKKAKNQRKKWDKYLVDYKNYFKEYKRLYKNSQNGDASALSQYPYMRAKWDVLKDRIIKAHGKHCLTEKQIDKVVKINMKIIKTCF